MAAKYIDGNLSPLFVAVNGYLPEHVGKAVKRELRERGMRQADLAALLGISQSHLANVVRGHDPASAALIERLRWFLLSAPAPGASRQP